MGAAQKNERVQYSDLSASALVKGGKGRYYGFYVNSTSSGAFIIYDSLTAAGTKIQNTVTPAIGLQMFNVGVDFENGLYFSLSSGSIDITFFYA